LAIFPVRNLASKGILRDPSPYQLDLEAWSQGLGVRFHANKVQSAPIFRLIQDSLSSPPQEIFGYEPSTGYDMMFVYGQNGSVGRYQDLTYSDVSAVNSVGAITITASGSGYSVSAPPTVTFSAASGTGAVTATGVAIISLAGLLVGILVTNTGWYPTGTPPQAPPRQPARSVTRRHTIRAHRLGLSSGMFSISISPAGNRSTTRPKAPPSRPSRTWSAPGRAAACAPLGTS
jgi:hypothetical protein